MAAYKSCNEQCIWISALTNRITIQAMMVKDGRQSMHILAERINEVYFRVPSGKLSTGFMPVYNPQDGSQWPELLGWLVTVGEMREAEL
jgi:hypothetical protein